MRAHRDLPITKHEISRFFRPVILLRDVRKVNVNNNHLAPARAAESGPDTSRLITLHHATAVRLKNNTILKETTPWPDK